MSALLLSLLLASQPEVCLFDVPADLNYTLQTDLEKTLDRALLCAETKLTLCQADLLTAQSQIVTMPPLPGPAPVVIEEDSSDLRDIALIVGGVVVGFAVGAVTIALVQL